MNKKNGTEKKTRAVELHPRDFSHFKGFLYNNQNSNTKYFCFKVNQYILRFLLIQLYTHFLNLIV